MRQILVTGANKGIGLATVRAVLEQTDDTHVLLGSRDMRRGESARASLCDGNAGWEERVTVLPVDVADDASVADAKRFLEGLEERALYGIVNNAGIGLGSSDMRSVVNVNTLGVMRVCDAFLPLLVDSGRVVNVSSASGPKFVSDCSASWQSFFTDDRIEWSAIQGLIDDVVAASEGAGSDALRGMDLGNAYGFSKACTTLYTMLLARENPQFVINACTPGYIETDLTRFSAQQQGVAPADLGMKPPAEGTRAILHLLFGQPHGSGHYYGSDARRSPLDRYRAPGSPEYLG